MAKNGQAVNTPIQVSVVIPVYNRPSTIGRAVESVLHQNNVSFEIILVDDASTDNTFAVISALQSPYIRILHHSKNRGAAAARNTGLAAATGKYVAFLDSDDIWLEGKLAAQVEAMEREPEVDLCFTGLYIEMIDEQRTLEKRHSASDDWLRTLSAGCDLSPGTVMLARREVFDRIGVFDESMRRFEDWDWLLRYAEANGQILLLNQLYAKVYNKRGRLGGENEIALERFLRKHRNTLSKSGESFRLRIESEHWFGVAMTYVHEGRSWDAIRCCFRAFRGQPLYWGRNFLYVLVCALIGKVE